MFLNGIVESGLLRLFGVLVNGRDITPGLVSDDIRDYHVLDDGDVIALSGAVHPD